MQRPPEKFSEGVLGKFLGSKYLLEVFGCLGIGLISTDFLLAGLLPSTAWLDPSTALFFPGSTHWCMPPSPPEVVTNPRTKKFHVLQGKHFSCQSSSQRMIPLPVNNRTISYYIGGSPLKLHFWMWDHPGILSHLKSRRNHRSFWGLKNGISGSYWSVQLFIFPLWRGKAWQVFTENLVKPPNSNLCATMGSWSTKKWPTHRSKSWLISIVGILTFHIILVLVLWGNLVALPGVYVYSPYGPMGKGHLGEIPVLNYLFVNWFRMRSL